MTTDDADTLDAIEASALETSSADPPRDDRDPIAALQVHTRRQMLRSRYPDARDWMVELDGRPVGRVLVSETPAEVRLVDMALLPAWRGRGIGTDVLRTFQDQAERDGRPLRLSVTHDNPARRLYLRLGFRPYAEDDVFVRMEWRAALRLPDDGDA